MSRKLTIAKRLADNPRKLSKKTIDKIYSDIQAAPVDKILRRQALIAVRRLEFDEETPIFSTPVVYSQEAFEKLLSGETK